jgi:hypothetical protein
MLSLIERCPDIEWKLPVWDRTFGVLNREASSSGRCLLREVPLYWFFLSINAWQITNRKKNKLMVFLV